MPACRALFAAAFFRQAQSDWNMYQRLVGIGAARCHQLHYLQMACEKLAKAYRLRDLDADVDELAKRHVGFTKFINAFLRSPAMLARYEGKSAAHEAVCRSASALARGIEKLAPAIDRAESPENAEYPWESGDRVVAPCEFTYPALSLLEQPGGRAFLKLLGSAFSDYPKATIR